MKQASLKFYAPNDRRPSQGGRGLKHPQRIKLPLGAVAPRKGGAD